MFVGNFCRSIFSGYSVFQQHTKVIARAINISTPLKMDLSDVIKKLKCFAPIKLAAEWDNVGLLVEPSPPHKVKNVLMTNDLTEEVLDEAFNQSANLIISYHPPIFVPLKRLTMDNVKERIIVRAIEKRVAVYSPHTSWDAVEGGNNDWLISAFGDNKNAAPIIPSSSSQDSLYRLELNVGVQDKTRMQTLLEESKATYIKCQENKDGISFSSVCNKASLSAVLEVVVNETTNVQVSELWKEPHSNTSGMGRFLQLDSPLSVSDCVSKVKSYLRMDHVQLALGSGKSLDSKIASVAVCAGAGNSVVKKSSADLYLTGEMMHHDVLAAVSKGITVITCNHSNTERGYLQVVKSKFETLFEGKLNVIISKADADPLKVV